MKRSHTHFSASHPLANVLPSTSATALRLGPDDDQDETLIIRRSIDLRILPHQQQVAACVDALKHLRNSADKRILIAHLAKANHRQDKDVEAMTDLQKAELFARKSYRLPNKVIALIHNYAYAEQYSKDITSFISQLTGDSAKDQAAFQELQQKMPADWAEAAAADALSYSHDTGTFAALLQATHTRINLPKLRLNLPFTIDDPPATTPLDLFLYHLHKTEPAKAKPLIESLPLINPSRPENSFLLAQLDAELPDNPDLRTRAWHLTGRLYKWGAAAETADHKFDLTPLSSNAEVSQAILEDPALAAARAAVGEYLLRQLYHADPGLFIKLLPTDYYNQYTTLLEPVLLDAANQRLTEPDFIRALVSRFPQALNKSGILAKALRFQSQFAAATTELQRLPGGYAIERALCKANVANADALELPATLADQNALRDRLKCVDIEDSNPEIDFCKAIRLLLYKDQASACAAFELLPNLCLHSVHYHACLILAALFSQKETNVRVTFTLLNPEQIRNSIVAIPNNLLHLAMRNLALSDYIDVATPLIVQLYETAPEALEILLPNHELLARHTVLLQRMLDKAENKQDSLQKWHDYKTVLDIATTINNPEIATRAIEACLAITDPKLAPYRAELLSAQIADAKDLDIKEVLTEQLAQLQPEEAKPLYHSLLKTYLGQMRKEDAKRMLDALEELGEAPAQLQQYKHTLHAAKPAANQDASGRLPRPVSIAFFGGDECEKPKTDQLRRELMEAHPGLTVDFDHTAWNVKNLAALLSAIAKYDVIVASNLMRTTTNHRLRQRARELGKVFGFCRTRGKSCISKSITDALWSHLAGK